MSETYAIDSRDVSVVPKNTLDTFLKELDHEPNTEYWKGWHSAIRVTKQYIAKNEVRA